MFKQTIKNGGNKLMKIFTNNDQNPFDYVNSFYANHWINTRTNFNTLKDFYDELINENTEWIISYDSDDCILMFENQKGKYAEYINIEEDQVIDIF